MSKKFLIAAGLAFLPIFAMAAVFETGTLNSSYQNYPFFFLNDGQSYGTGLNFIDPVGSDAVVNFPGKSGTLATLDDIEESSGTSTASWGEITGTLTDQIDLNEALSDKQDALVSATNIKSINSNSLLGSGDLSVLLSSQIFATTRDLTLSNGDVSYTGCGFRPRAIIVAFNDYNATSPWQGVGFVDQDGHTACFFEQWNGNSNNGSFILLVSQNGSYEYATVKSIDDNGFTLTWTKSGTPSGTVTMNFLCLR